jgi:hypothetical protein
MNALKFGLDWFVDEKGYRVEGADNSRTIVPMGGDLRRIKPLEKDRLFHTFAQVGSDADLLNFVENYGLLETPGDRTDYGATVFDPDTMRPVPNRPVMFGESVADHLKTASMFAKTMAFAARRGRASLKLSEFIHDRLLDDQLGRISWGFSPSAGFTMQLAANTLLNGMLMQLAQEISAQPAFRLCEYCKKPFALGSRAGRRAHAIFCSPEHKKQFHSRKRSLK